MQPTPILEYAVKCHDCLTAFSLASFYTCTSAAMPLLEFYWQLSFEAEKIRAYLIVFDWDGDISWTMTSRGHYFSKWVTSRGHSQRVTFRGHFW